MVAPGGISFAHFKRFATVIGILSSHAGRIPSTPTDLENTRWSLKDERQYRHWRLGNVPSCTGTFRFFP